MSPFAKVEYLKMLRNSILKSIENKKIEGVERTISFCKYLDNNGIEYELLLRHNEVLGCEESIKYYERFKEYLNFDYAVCKHILVHERSGERRNYLIITDSSKRVDFNNIRDNLNCRKLEFVNSLEMKNLINAIPGSVSLFNIIFDSENRVKIVLDKSLFESEILVFHPLYNGMSMFIRTEECLNFLELIKREAYIIDINNTDKSYQKK